MELAVLIARAHPKKGRKVKTTVLHPSVGVGEGGGSWRGS